MVSFNFHFLHFYQTEKINIKRAVVLTFTFFNYQDNCDYDNLKGETTNEADENGEEVGHSEDEHQYCKLAIAKPEAKQSSFDEQRDEDREKDLVRLKSMTGKARMLVVRPRASKPLRIMRLIS